MKTDLINDPVMEAYTGQDAEEYKELSDLLGPEKAKKIMDEQIAKRQEREAASAKAIDAAMASGKKLIDDVVSDTKNAYKKYFNTNKDESTLTQFYDDLNSGMHGSVPIGNPMMMKVSGGPGAMMSGMSHPGAIAFKQKCSHECEKLKDKCAKHIILDIYCHILPLDDKYVCTHHHQMAQDVDCMLDKKGMRPMEYLRSCSEKTKAPLLEFVTRSINNIGKSFMEAENEKLADAQANDTEVPVPEAPEPEDNNDIANQLVDVKKDMEYDSFVDELKKKTIDKIVADVSDIIADKKSEQDMEFNPQPIADQQAAQESVISVGLDYMSSRLLKENVEVTSDLNDQMIAMAIRESTLNQLDVVFKQPGSDDRSLKNRIRLGKGTIINESTLTAFVESTFNTK